MSVVAYSCQEERFVFVDQANNLLGETETINTSLANLLVEATASENSFDDIIDNAPCVQIKFPYSVLIDGNTIIINSKTDIEEFPPNIDPMPIFPITIIYDDYSEEEITTANTFFNLAAFCSADEDLINRIDCVVWNYPVTVSFFNVDTGVFQVETYTEDKPFFEGVTSFYENTLVGIHFPVEILINNLPQTIQNNEALQAQLTFAKNNCL